MSYNLEFEEDREQCFREQSLIKKNDVLFRIKDIKRGIKKQEASDQKHSAVFYRTWYSLMERFEEEVKGSILFDDLEPWWGYTVEIDTLGAYLQLEHTSDAIFNENECITSSTIDQTFTLVTTPTRLLTVDEYAKQYEVEQGTVRQWIRRGKLRSAVKAGKEWRLPELTEPPTRGYRRGYYTWNRQLIDVPDDLSYLNLYHSVSLEQSGTCFVASFHSKETGYVTKTIDGKERERLEMFLIANPDVKATAECFGCYA